jgi:hypothetical protein
MPSGLVDWNKLNKDEEISRLSEPFSAKAF